MATSTKQISTFKTTWLAGFDGLVGFGGLVGLRGLVCFHGLVGLFGLAGWMAGIFPMKLMRQKLIKHV